MNKTLLNCRFITEIALLDKPWCTDTIENQVTTTYISYPLRSIGRNNNYATNIDLNWIYTLDVYNTATLVIM
ncbi:MAG: hypothetical protein LBH74_09600 [Nitrososphaerota archaeon]|uniref:hypothetical protein n=1 Tax=Candidatus Bathycorpusculum sp. TaxID=2994959 RepID=UPI0028307E98|nr:hypothetical protein [Candidatus Termitimicrobium sp.]MCL2431949.1 hypothetical protein [Candidatus Termitimicrobium sp.]MDR0493872.1 hypothetical protein [Nitrososphaerota archaeon]